MNSKTTSSDNRRPGSSAAPPLDIYDKLKSLRKEYNAEEDELLMDVTMEQRMEQLLMGEGDADDQQTFNALSSASGTQLVAKLDPERAVDRELLSMCHGRLKRRMQLVDALRSAYLSDVVMLKETIDTYCSEQQRGEITIKWHASIPSLDTKRLLWMHSPNETTLTVIPCEMCGGSPEVVHHDSPEIDRLTKLVAVYDSTGQELKVTIGTLKAKARTCSSSTFCI